MEYLGLRCRTSFYQHTKTQENSLLKHNRSLRIGWAIPIANAPWNAIPSDAWRFRSRNPTVCLPTITAAGDDALFSELIASSARRCCRCVWVWAPFRKRGCKRQTQNSAHMALVVASLFPCWELLQLAKLWYRNGDLMRCISQRDNNGNEA